VLQFISWWIGWVFQWLFVRALRSFRNRRGKRQRVHAGWVVRPGSATRSQTKPAWVLREVLLKALMPGAGCRHIAFVFNQRFAPSHSVSKSYVSYSIRKNVYEIEVLQRKLKHQMPRPQPRNEVWGIDMTGKADASGVVHLALGIVDHGSRMVLKLQWVNNKNAWTLLGHLLLAMGRHGRPRSVRTDNEACFASRVFAAGLWLAGIAHQRTVPGCPWMNGTIERLFGTLKCKLRDIPPQCQHVAPIGVELSFSRSSVIPLGLLSLLLKKRDHRNRFRVSRGRRPAKPGKRRIAILLPVDLVTS
jgi:putative transposase